MSAHTPGPWTVEPTTNDDYDAYIVGGDGTSVATVNSSNDARLIAAAPDMLAALEEVQTALARFRDDEPYSYRGQALCLEEVKYVIVDAAIRKAKGNA